MTVNAKTSASAGNTWRDLPAAQQPEYPDTEALRAVIADLESYPPLVFAGECDQLRARMAAVAKGEAFLLQGGDCAEAFDAVSADHIRNKLKTLLQMGAVLTYAASVPVVKVGRIAGQYSKPRSKGTETRDGVTLPTYRGDSVNGFEFNEKARIPDPERLKRMYNASASTLNLVRAFTTGGYADLRQVHAWNQDFVKSSPSGQRYEQLAREIDQALNFMRACGTDPEEFKTVEFYSSHEALLLDYESALTRVDSRSGQLYDVSAHMVWIGERTRQLDHAHIEFASQIRNPVGIKLGPTTTAEEALQYIERLGPRPRARPADLHRAHGRRQGPRQAARAGREGHRLRRDRRLDHRPDARQHLRGGLRPQDPPLRRRARRGQGVLRGPQGPRHPPGRHPRRAHR
ncbi:3-deoxy-7-phosphoheptulonate synthase class II [Streptomyces sp. SAI-126]